MKATITKQAVAEAIKALTDSGKKPTLAAIHAALGGKGSITTLVKLKGELDQEASTPQDSTEGLAQFRSLWAAAVAEGKASMESQMQELRAGLEAVSLENERLEAAAIAAEARLAELVGQRDKLVNELSQAINEATTARAQGEQNAIKLAECLERMERDRAAQVSEFRDMMEKIQAEREKVHALQVERATITEQLKQANHSAADAWKSAARMEAEHKKLEEAALDADRLRADLAEAKREITRLTKAKKPNTPKA